MSLCVCVSVCVHVCVRVCVCVCTYKYDHTCIYIYMYKIHDTYTCMYIHMYVYILNECSYTRAYTYMFMYTCIPMRLRVCGCIATTHARFRTASRRCTNWGRGVASSCSWKLASSQSGVAVCCSVLQCVAVCCSVMQGVAGWCVAVFLRVLRVCVTVRCSAL